MIQLPPMTCQSKQQSTNQEPDNEKELLEDLPRVFTKDDTKWRAFLALFSNLSIDEFSQNYSSLLHSVFANSKVPH